MVEETWADDRETRCGASLWLNGRGHTTRLSLSMPKTAEVGGLIPPGRGIGCRLGTLPRADLTNAIKIRRGKETFVYRTSRSEEKKALLGAFRQVAEELAAKKRKENEKEQERRKSMWTGDVGEVWRFGKSP